MLNMGFTNDETPLSFLDLTALGIGNTLGIGVFVLLGELTRTIAGPAAVISICLAALAAILAGLCFSEFGVRFQKANTAYLYCYTYHNEIVSFVFGWVLILHLTAGTASISKGITTFVDALTGNEIVKFLNETTPISFRYGSPYFDFVSALIIFTVLVPMMFGLKDYLFVKNLFTAVNIALVFSVIVAGASKADLKNWGLEKFSSSNLFSWDGFAPFGIFGIFKGAATGFYGFIGFEGITSTGNYVKRPNLTIPLAVFIALFLTFIFYVGIEIVLTMMSPYVEHNLGAALVFAFENSDLTAFKWVISVGAFFGFQTSLFGAIFALPKVVCAMANDELLFRWLGQSEKNKISTLAIFGSGLVAILASGFFTFQQLVHLTVFTSLFLSIVLAIDIIMLRYSSKHMETENSAEKSLSLPSVIPVVSFSQILTQLFYYNSNTPTKFTERLIIINLVIFITASTGLSVIFTQFTELLFINGGLEAIIPAVILLLIVVLTVISMACQSKFKIQSSFKVPFVPVFPCLSIFLNIFLMVIIDSSTFVLFIIWMVLGLFPHFIWYSCKYLRGDSLENSVFEINKLNAIKLNESIWKINEEKRNFYEGAVNPVFEDDNGNFLSVNRCVEPMAKMSRRPSIETEPKKETDGLSTSFAADSSSPKQSVDDNKEDGKNSDSQREPNNLVEESNWECTAQIHIEEFNQEGYEVQIVDNTYNFLTHLTEEYPKDELSSDENSHDIPEYQKPTELNNVGSLSSENDRNLSSSTLPTEIREDYAREKTKTPESILNSTNTDDSNSVKEHNKKKRRSSLQESKNKKTQNGDNNNNNNDNDDDDDDDDVFYKNPTAQIDENLIKNPKVFSDKKLNPPGKGRRASRSLSYDVCRIEENKSRVYGNTNFIESADSPVTQNKEHRKDFKEKLNLLLRNQINVDGSLKQDFRYRRNSDSDCEKRSEKLKVVQNSIRTLNKSQIKNKLEFLLAKGPPKRISLGSSFNIQVKEKSGGDTLKAT